MLVDERTRSLPTPVEAGAGMSTMAGSTKLRRSARQFFGTSLDDMAAKDDANEGNNEGDADEHLYDEYETYDDNSWGWGNWDWDSWCYRDWSNHGSRQNHHPPLEVKTPQTGKKRALEVSDIVSEKGASPSEDDGGAKSAAGETEGRRSRRARGEVEPMKTMDEAKEIIDNMQDTVRRPAQLYQIKLGVQAFVHHTRETYKVKLFYFPNFVSVFLNINRNVL